WVIFAALTAFVLYALLRPLTGTTEADSARAAFDASVYRDQLTEIESDRERGLIGDADAEAARIEIARRLLGTEADSDSTAATPRRALGPKLAIALALLLPLLSLVA